MLGSGGQPALDRLLARLGPVSLVALLATLVLLFGFQGEQIVAQPLVIVLLAVPILIQVYFNAGLAYWLSRRFGVAWCVAAPAALIGASNFFELAVAAAISLFGLNSGAALATVVGRAGRGAGDAIGGGDREALPRLVRARCDRMSKSVFYRLQHRHYAILRVSLEAAQLPTEDLLEPGRIFFGLADDSGPIGYVGLEGEGPDLLLRSLVILPSRRNQGHGAALLRHLETWASDAVEGSTCLPPAQHDSLPRMATASSTAGWRRRRSPPRPSSPSSARRAPST